MINKTCFFLCHFSTGDCLTMYPAILKYASIYESIVIFSLARNEQMMKQLYDPFWRVRVIILPSNYPNGEKYHYYLPETLIKKFCPNLEDFDIVKTGNSFNENNDIIPEWNNLNHIGDSWRKFYHQANIPYEHKLAVKYINRNEQRENEFYNLITNSYGHKYIFFQDHRHYNYNHQGRYRELNLNINNKNIPIFHPNFNYYQNEESSNKNLWSPILISNNLLDYCKVLENAEEIHIIDSSFSCLCAYLNLSKVKVKVIYTPLDYESYDPCFKDWEKK